MREVLPGIWTWSVHNDERGMDFHGWYVRGRDAAVIVDPPSAQLADVKEMAAHGRPVAILLTNKHHTRDTLALRGQFGCPVWVHESDAPLMEIDFDSTYSDGAILPAGLLAVTLPDSKTPGESALFALEQRAMIIGDAVLGKPAGSLSMLPDAKFKDPAAARRGLAKLLEHDFDALLLGDGDSILSGAKATLAAFAG